MIIINYYILLLIIIYYYYYLFNISLYIIIFLWIIIKYH
jgi:hypothetical protein